VEPTGFNAKRFIGANKIGKPYKFKGYFILGPLPLGWFAKASLQRGASTPVGLILWFLAGLNDSELVQLTPKFLRQFGISRHSTYRALKKLESAGLISVRRKKGCGPEVRIIRLEELKP
jgi:hypothetical protein